MIIFEGRHPGNGFPADLIGRARRKLIMLDEAETLADIGRLPGNHLEALKKDRAGQHSIMINDSMASLLRVDRERCPERRDRGLPSRSVTDAY